MADTLLIHYSPADPAQPVWSVANSTGELISKLTRGSLEQAVDIAKNKRVVMLLDSNYIHINHLELPTKNKQKLLHAAPFALEEQLADEVEDLHFVISGTLNKERTAVACIAKELLNSILSQCDDAGIRLDAIIPDALCLTADQDQWAILLFNETAYIHQNAYASTCIERSCYRDLLSQILKDEITVVPNKIFLFQAQGEEPETIEHNTLDKTEIIPVAYNDHPLVIFCGNYKNALSLNLLQGEYKPVGKGNTQLQHWRLAASLALFWLIAHLGHVAYQSDQLKTSNQSLRAQIVKTYKESFPESRKIVNARVQMEQKLNGLRSGNNDDADLLSLLADSHPAFSSNKDVAINSINYRNQHMDITITSSNLNSVELVNKKLNNSALKSEIISSTSEKNIVKGNIRIQRPKS